MCPICYAAFENSEILTQHFHETHDSPTGSVNSSNSNLDQVEKSNKKKNETNSLFTPKIESVIKQINFFSRFKHK